jgi:hypothetical protein
MAYRDITNTVKNPRIVMSKFGNIKDEEADYIIRVMKECYSRLEPHEVALVDLYIFKYSSSMDAFTAKEFKEVGVSSSSFDELFFAMHDAYRGISRIIICLERMEKLPKLVQVAGIRHEVGHSVLHGSPSYYLLSLPLPLLDFIDCFNVSRQYAINLFYLISIAVKDYEVSRLLYGRGYVEDQLAYAKHLLTVTESDERSWEVSREKPLAEILCLVSCLKSAGCAVPLLSDKRLCGKIKRLLAESLSYLPTEYSMLLLDMIPKSFASLGADTLSNIDKMACLVVENIAKPIFTK